MCVAERMPFAGGGDWAVALVNWEAIFDSVLQFYFLSYLMVGRGLDLCSCSCWFAFRVMANCSQSGTNQSFPLQTGG